MATGNTRCPITHCARPAPAPLAPLTPALRGFSLTELLIVLGLLALLVSLLLPVVGKARAAANAASCLSNLRQMGAAWVTYTTESRGHLMHYAWNPTGPSQTAWGMYWPGVLDAAKVGGQTLLCPAASEISQDEAARGYGDATRAWTGRFARIGSVVRLSDTRHRDSSYGYNRFLTAGGGAAGNSQASHISALKGLSEMPVFFDCAYADVLPVNGSADSPVQSPPNLRGDRLGPGAPSHWNVLLARHGRGVNVCTADGAARWTRLEDLYALNWRNGWSKYRLKLPAR